jgi:hypothetical protein
MQLGALHLKMRIPRLSVPSIVPSALMAGAFGQVGEAGWLYEERDCGEAKIL